MGAVRASEAVWDAACSAPADCPRHAGSPGSGAPGGIEPSAEPLRSKGAVEVPDPGGAAPVSWAWREGFPEPAPEFGSRRQESTAGWDL